MDFSWVPYNERGDRELRWSAYFSRGSLSAEGVRLWLNPPGGVGVSSFHFSTDLEIESETLDDLLNELATITEGTWTNPETGDQWIFYHLAGIIQELQRVQSEV